MANRARVDKVRKKFENVQINTGNTNAMLDGEKFKNSSTTNFRYPSIYFRHHSDITDIRKEPNTISSVVRQRSLFEGGEGNIAAKISHKTSYSFRESSNVKHQCKLISQRSFNADVKRPDKKPLHKLNLEKIRGFDEHKPKQQNPLRKASLKTNAITDIINHFNNEESICQDIYNVFNGKDNEEKTIKICHKQSKLLTTKVMIEDVGRGFKKSLNTYNFQLGLINVQESPKNYTPSVNNLHDGYSLVKNIIEKFNKSGVLYANSESLNIKEHQISNHNNIAKVTIDKTIQIYDDDIDVDESEYDIVNIRTETYFDQNSNPRIENAYNLDTVSIDSGYKSDELCANSTKKSSEEYAIKELIDSERTFIKGLQFLIQNYMPSDPTRCIYSLIRQLHENCEIFVEKIEMCNYDTEKIIAIFFESETLFQLYVKYMRIYRTELIHRGRPNCESNDKSGQQIGLNNSLNALLLTPVQKLPRYKLLLENLYKCVKDSAKHWPLIKSAINFLDAIIRKADTLQAVDSILACPFDLTKKGFYMRAQEFDVKKKYRSTVFLFEGIVVFTIEINPMQFQYQDSIDMDVLSIRSISTDKNVFHLKNFSKCKHGDVNEKYTFTLECKQSKIAALWLKDISDLLWKQLTISRDMVKDQIQL